MKYSVLFGLLFLWRCIVLAQPATEVWLFDLKSDGSVTNPVNVSNNPGYDNQPSFTRGGNLLLFTSTRNGQTDIVSYEIATSEKTWLTDTPASEYSPLQIPGTFTFSTIGLEENGRQLLWNYSLNGGKGEILIPYLKIGYHVWITDTELYAFVLGPHSTLQKIDLSAQRAEIIQENIGRSLAYHNEQLYFLDKSNEITQIKSLDLQTGESVTVIDAIPNSEDFVISSNGEIYMGQNSTLYRYTPGTDSVWHVVADLKVFNLTNISRLAIAADNNKIAMVTAE